jgi:tetratricopeptide (TPR) repeat protein
MDALISGSNGRALLFDGGSLKSFDEDDPSMLAPRVPADFAYLFGEMQDLRVLENTNIEAVRQELKRDSDCTIALDLALILLDAELPDDIRQEALEGLDDLLADDRIVEHLEKIFYARPLPEDSDLRGAVRLCEAKQSSRISNFLRILQVREPFVSEVSEAWDAIPTKVFGDYDQQAEFQHTVVREGLFRTLVIARERQSTISTFLLNAGLNSAITQLRNHRQVLQQWTSSFRDAGALPSIKNEIEEEIEAEPSPRRRRGRRVGIDRPAMLREVNRRKSIIVEALLRSDLSLIAELVDDLVDYQRSGEAVHVAKSLCDLAMEAKSLGMFALQLELTERSINIASDDAWSWVQYGDALLNMGQFDNALSAFEQADAFAAGVVAKTGRAEVLKAKGLLDDALAAYEEVIALHPEDVVAKTGRAEVLKAKGLLDDALAAYEEVIALHPEDVVAKNGGAEVLKTKGLLDDALAAYEKVIALHPENAIAKRGRAEVLKAKGLFDDALLAYEEVIALHPENAIAKNGRADVLKAKGLFHDALAAYEQVIALHPEDAIAKNGRGCMLAALGRFEEALTFLPNRKPVNLQDWIGRHIRGMILLKAHRRNEAIQILNEGLQECPWPVQKEYFRAALVVAWLRGGDLTKAQKHLEDVKLPQLQPAANVLRLHVFGAEGNLQSANIAYQSLEATPLHSNELTKELQRRFLLNEQPHHDDEWISDHEVDLFLQAA